MHIRDPSKEGLLGIPNFFPQLLYGMMQGIRRVRPVKSADTSFDSPVQKVAVEIRCNLWRVFISNSAHPNHHSAISSGQHPSGQMNHFLRKPFLTGASLTCLKESEICVLEILLNDFRELQRATMESKSTLKWLVLILRCMAGQVNAAKIFHVLKYCVDWNVALFDTQHSHSMIDGLFGPKDIANNNSVTQCIIYAWSHGSPCQLILRILFLVYINLDSTHTQLFAH
ncbi:hypothetical protein H1R20_g11327, partial [Candolleomyces eurysporus]